MKSKFHSTKIIPLGSTAFRQPFADSHCKFLHGYRLQAKFWFSCDELDNNNWVVDFGCLKKLKEILEKTFDHTTCIWDKDPEKPLFEFMHSKGVIDLRIFEEGVGIEKFAEFCHTKANEFVKEYTKDRCWCSKVEVWEHELNSATYETPEGCCMATVKPELKIEEKAPEPSKSHNLTSPMVPPSNAQPQAAPLYGTKSGGYKGMFEGTSWGKR